MIFNLNGPIGGIQIYGGLTRAGDSEYSSQVTLAAANAGVLSTRTDADTGIATLAADHTIVTGNTVDVYWSGGIRRGMTVGTVSGTSVPLDAGAGDNLPVATTAITVCKVTVIDIDLTGNTVMLSAFSQSRSGSISVQQGDGTVIKNIHLGLSGTDGEAWIWANNTDVSNPFAAVSIGKVVVSNASSIGTSVVSLGFVLDNA